VSNNDDDSDDDIQIIRTHHKPHPSMPPSPATCVALWVEFLPGQMPHNSYPFVMHNANVLQWDIEICQNVLYLHVWNCSGIPEDDQGACRACTRLHDDMKLKGILEWIVKGMKPSTSHQYWSWGVLQNNLLQVCKCLASKELLLFNTYVYVKLG